MNMAKSFVVGILLILACAGHSTAGDISLLTNKDFFPALDDKIKRAREEIDISIYLFRTAGSGSNLATRIRNSLIDAAHRGVKVTVFLEKEKRGKKDSFLNEDNDYTAKILSRGGVRVRFDSPHTTTHTKLTVIDNRFVFVGSHNLTESALRWNNEASMMVDSPSLAREVVSYLRRIGGL